MATAFEKLSSLIPEYAKDIRLNLSSMMRQTELSNEQLYGCAVAAALSSKNEKLISLVLTEAKDQLEEQYFNAAKTAAALMGMNNIYYRFTHFTSNENYSTMPAKLRMNAIRSHGIENTDFELFSLVASAVTGCGVCVDSHEKTLREHGCKEASIVAAIRVAAVIHAAAVTLFDLDIDQK